MKVTPLFDTTYLTIRAVCEIFAREREWETVYKQARIKVGVGPRHCTTVGPSVSHLSPSIHTATLLVSLAT